ncbi:MAG TPA: hypothetical protein VIK91_09220 [Nannocystis sp.]
MTPGILGSLRRLTLAAAVSSAAVAPAACAPYVVVQQSGPPSALREVQALAVSFDWSPVWGSGKPEAAYLAEKSAEEKADFAKIKQETDAAIFSALQESGVPVALATDEAPANVVVQYAQVETGVYAVVYSAPTMVLVRFSWLKDGKATDIIDAEATVSPSMSMPSDHQRMEMTGRRGAAPVRSAARARAAGGPSGRRRAGLRLEACRGRSPSSSCSSGCSCSTGCCSPRSDGGGSTTG